MTDLRDLNEPVPDFTPPPWPDEPQFDGAYARLERLEVHHANDLHRAFRANDAIWDYMFVGPYSNAAEYADFIRSLDGQADPVFYAILDKSTGHFAGVASYLRIHPEAGSIEVGSISFSPELQRTRAATDAMYLMMRWAFDAGYRRYEWKCNAANRASRRAAQRLGFSFEGVFRQAAVTKGRNRDTAWFAAIDAEWPDLRQAFENWLAPANFDEAGHQKVSLSELTRPILVAADPG